ncbi:MAG TPA: hypothetical protein VFI59_14410 [Actinomycetota bacterium]|nr:hypothetical protein [Actinomycetota bacterium]
MDADDPSRLGVIENVFARPAQCRLHKSHGRTRRRAGNKQCLLLTLREHLDPGTKKGAEILGDGKRFTQLGLPSLELHRADDL